MALEYLNYENKHMENIVPNAGSNICRRYFGFINLSSLEKYERVIP
jgi:hypothetical protein